MAKLKPTPIDSSTLERYLATEDDFAFEFTCFRELNGIPGLRISHGGSYSDPVTNLNRQYDLRVRIELDQEVISLAIECKNLKPNFPLLISRVMRRKSECFHLVTPNASQNTLGIKRMLGPSRETVGFPKSMYNNATFVGKSTVQVGVTQSGGDLHGSDSEVHDRWAQAIASAYSLISEAARELLDREDEDVWRHVILPVLVVPDGVLWACDYDESGNRGPAHQADEIEFFLEHSPWKIAQNFTYTISHLHFVTKTGLRRLINRIREDGGYQREMFPHQ
jgi:hypothetical protein